LPLYKAIRTVSLFFPHIARLLRHRMSPYSYDRATIGLSDIRDMLYSLKPRGVCTTWPCCSAIPGLSVGQTNRRSALFGKGSYMAPEQAAGEHAKTGASPLGVIWELTGRVAPSFRSDEVNSKTYFSRQSRRVTDKAHHGLLMNRNDHALGAGLSVSRAPPASAAT